MLLRKFVCNHDDLKNRTPQNHAMTTNKLLTFLTVTSIAASANAASVLLAGFDGNNTYLADTDGNPLTPLVPGGVFQSAGDKYIRDPHQSAAAVTAGFTSELYMFSNVAKEMQWGGAGQTSLGYWGASDTGLTPAPSTANGTNVYTVTDTSTLEFRVTNGGSGTITLDNIFFAARRDSSTLSGATMTVSYASGDLAALGGGTTTVTFAASTANTGYDVDLSSILSDNTLGAGESAVFTLVSGAGTSRLKIDDIGISGVIPEPGTALLGGLGLLALLRRRRS
jgi:uncharacterized protein (TIGR03382 family)